MKWSHLFIRIGSTPFFRLLTNTDKPFPLHIEESRKIVRLCEEWKGGGGGGGGLNGQWVRFF